MIFWAVAFTAIGQARQSPENKWEPEIKKFEESDRQKPAPKGAVVIHRQFLYSVVAKSRGGLSRDKGH